MEGGVEVALAKELFARAQRGDAAALGQLLETYREQLHRAARSQLDSQVGVRTDASDIVQGTFLEAQRDFTQFRGESVAQLLAWLRTILDHNVSNTIQHHVFVQKRSIDRERSLDDSKQFGPGKRPLPASDLSTPSHRAIRSEDAARLEAAIESLPEDQRESVRLRHIEGRSLKEIAEQFDRSIVAVAGLIKRGLRALKGEFADEIQEQAE
jgi:RNA polymerase sigma-70 factor (ECF subfamily)